MRHKRLNTLSGFSLIEMSIIVTAFAVLMTAMLGGKSIERDAKIFLNTQDKIVAIEQAIAHYINFYGHLPCPASLIEPMDSADFGKSTDNCADGTTAPAGTSHIDNGTGADEYQLRFGMVPTRALGLKDDYAIDEWGNRISYVMIRSLGTAAGYSSFAPSQTTDYFKIFDAQGNVLVGNSPTDIPAYFVFSHGKDARGAYTKEGNIPFNCGDPLDISLADRVNCDLNKEFTISPINDLSTDNTFYYDVGSWRKLSATTTASGTATAYNPVNSIFVTYDTTCLIAENGHLFCAGKNEEGMLASGVDFSTLSSSNTFIERVGNPTNWLMISGGTWDHACGIVSGGDAYCWGTNSSGKLGNNTAVANSNVPTLVHGGYKWKKISAGDFTAGITEDGKAYAWGHNAYYRTGTNLTNTQSTNVPLEIRNESGTYPGHTDWIDISVAMHHGCGIRQIDTNRTKLYCWGHNDINGVVAGLLGDNNTTPSIAYPQPVDTPYEDWYWVGTKSSHTCALREKTANGGRLYCWGGNSYGALGVGNSSPRFIPTEIPDDTNSTPGFSDWIYVSPGFHNSCGIRANGDAYCWGTNFRNALANSSFIGDRYYPLIVAGGHKWVSIAAFGDQSAHCGVTVDGDLYCWLFNTSGQWGNGSNAPNDGVGGWPLAPVKNTVFPYKVKHSH